MLFGTDCELYSSDNANVTEPGTLSLETSVHETTVETDKDILGVCETGRYTDHYVTLSVCLSQGGSRDSAKISDQ